MRLPLSSPLPLRTTAAWPNFAALQTLPHVYGRCTVAPIQFTADRKQWLLADHPIAGIEAVYRDGQAESGYALRHQTDAVGHPVAVVELATPLAASAKLSVAVRGKPHPHTGALITHPADILLDVLRLAGHDLPDDAVAEFRATEPDWQLGGALTGGLTVRAQLAEIMASCGAWWSLGMPGLIQPGPQRDRPAGAPIRAGYTVATSAEANAKTQVDTVSTVIRVEFDREWGGGESTRQSVTLAADTVADYGEREAAVSAPWLTDARLAARLGTAALAWSARPRWSVALTADLEPPLNPGDWFTLEHPLLPVSGPMRALEVVADWGQGTQQIHAEVAAGTLPEVTFRQRTGLYAAVKTGLRVSYAKGVVTLTITDADEMPVKGAKVTLDAQTARTDAKGQVSFKAERGLHTVSIEAAGFAVATSELTI